MRHLGLLRRLPGLELLGPLQLDLQDLDILLLFLLLLEEFPLPVRRRRRGRRRRRRGGVETEEGETYLFLMSSFSLSVFSSTFFSTSFCFCSCFCSFCSLVNFCSVPSRLPNILQGKVRRGRRMKSRPPKEEQKWLLFFAKVFFHFETI